ncbi:protein rep [Pediococcus acidilactici]|uniref:protein rep n=1 Tax=Pediococcus acidilactici TaxID=1254 RepID=UPI00132FFD71|nr:protein rep [Pediococcus acidilactici]KAF0333455.1 protein rep [Pediococcus acidilactici]KAF0449689.1 protein rep [Pediococcus acidilactici]KAF0525491.1 protein rep [Pediococcus acidilactici]
MADRKVLVDRLQSGKVRPWREHKLENLQYGDYLQMLHYKKAHRVKECGEVLRFVEDKNGHKKLAQTWFCHSRLCSLCNWRRSMKQSNQLTQILTETVKQRKTGRFLFLTLTVKNTTGDLLKSELRQMGRAIAKIFQYKKVAKNLLGYVRSTEVTINHEADQPMYHHHMHVLLFMKSSYFTGTDNYISQAEWTRYWQRTMKLAYAPVVNVEAVKPNVKRQKNSLLASAQETAKYQVKSKDILTNNQEQDLQVIDDLEQALAGSRQISYGGLLKEIRKQLQLEDVENGDLINTDSGDQETDQVVREIVAKWDYQRKNGSVAKFENQTRPL